MWNGEAHNKQRKTNYGYINDKNKKNKYENSSTTTSHNNKCKSDKSKKERKKNQIKQFIVSEERNQRTCCFQIVRRHNKQNSKKVVLLTLFVNRLAFYMKMVIMKRRFAFSPKWILMDSSGVCTSYLIPYTIAQFFSSRNESNRKAWGK